MFSPEQLALLGTVRDTSNDQTWAQKACANVEVIKQDLFDIRCRVAQKKSQTLQDTTKGFVVSYCAKHSALHTYKEAEAREAALSRARQAFGLIDAAGDELTTSESSRLRATVVKAQQAFLATVQTDGNAMKHLIARREAEPMIMSVPQHSAVSIKPMGFSPLQARKATASSMVAEIGITEAQLVKFYRCFRKKPYDTIASAVNATLLVHDNFEAMNVYLCAHCGYLHIGHRSMQGEAITPAFFRRAIAKWKAEPELASAFVAEMKEKRFQATLIEA